MLTEHFDSALLFASWLHRPQVRKGTRIPYISHLLGVTGLVIDDGGSQEEAMAALLHDALEDRGSAYPGGRDELRKYIAANFGPGVADIVDQCTDDEGFTKGQGPFDHERENWLARKQKYADSIAHKSAEALRVTAADKIHNAESIVDAHAQCGASIWQRFRTKSREDQIQVYAMNSAAITARARTLGDQYHSVLPARLARAVEQLKTLS